MKHWRSWMRGSRPHWPSSPPSRRQRSLAVFTGTALARPAAASPYKVGIIYCRTGPLAEYGAEYIEGLRFGLQYATNGTNTVNGHPIQLTAQGRDRQPRQRPSPRRRT